MFLNNSSQSCSTISDLMTHVLRSHILQKCILKIHSRLRTKVKNEAYTLLLIFTSRICGNVVHKVKSLKTRSAKPKRIHLFHRVNRLQASRALFYSSIFRHHQAFWRLWIIISDFGAGNRLDQVIIFQCCTTINCHSLSKLSSITEQLCHLET